MGGGAPHDPRRPALVFRARHPDGPDAQGRVPPGSAPDRRPDRFGHSPAWSRSLCSRPYHPEPPGRDLGGPTTTVRPRARAPAGGQHGPETLWAWRVADREAWHAKALGLAQDAPRGGDADTGRIVASELTTHDVDDGSQVGPLLDQVTG